MLWFGFFFYFFLLFFFVLTSLILFKNLFKFNFRALNLYFISLVSFLFIFSFLTISFCIKNFYLIEISHTMGNLFYFIFFSSNIIGVYIFPFVYIFLFITMLSILWCLSYNSSELIFFSIFCFFILFIGFSLFFTDSLVLFFFFYEMLLVPSFFILYKFAKTRRSVEAAFHMFFWTQFGAVFLFFIFFYIFLLTGSLSFFTLFYFSFSEFDVNFIFFSLILGFGVKFPIWPFYGWLPKAHVESSTNFSIFLSGVLVKFAFFGFFKCLLTIKLEPTFIFCFPFLMLGIFDSVFKLFYQIDLKKIVAYSTVIEMHWLLLCFISGYSFLFLSGFCMLISHAFLSTNFFFLVDAISRRFKTRLSTEINSINLLTPKLFLFGLLNLLIFLGFPGSIFFVAEFLFFSFLIDFFPILAFVLMVLLYLLAPSFFFKNWLNALCGSSNLLSKKICLDLEKKEVLLFFFLSLLIFWLGLTWQIFLF